MSQLTRPFFQTEKGKFKPSTTDGTSDPAPGTSGTTSTSASGPASAAQTKETISSQGSNNSTAEPNAEEIAAIQAQKGATEATALKGKASVTSDGAADTKDAPSATGTDAANTDASKPDAVKSALGSFLPQSSTWLLSLLILLLPPHVPCLSFLTCAQQR